MYRCIARTKRYLKALSLCNTPGQTGHNWSFLLYRIRELRHLDGGPLLSVYGPDTVLEKQIIKLLFYPIPSGWLVCLWTADQLGAKCEKLLTLFCQMKILSNK